MTGVFELSEMVGHSATGKKSNKNTVDDIKPEINTVKKSLLEGMKTFN